MGLKREMGSQSLRCSLPLESTSTYGRSLRARSYLTPDLTQHLHPDYERIFTDPIELSRIETNRE